MYRFLKNRFLPVLLALSVCLSLLVVPASAVSAVGSQIAAGNTTLTEALGDYPSFFEGVRTYITNCEFGSSSSSYAAGVSLYDRILEPSFIVDVGSVENLHDFATAININKDIGVNCLVSQTGTGPNDYYFIQYISVIPFGGGGFNRSEAISGMKLKYTAADENGNILVASVASAGAVEGQWLPYYNSLPQQMVEYVNLENLQLSLQENGINCSLTKMDVGYVLTKSTGTPPYHVTEVYCNPWGGMYVAASDNRVGDRVHVDVNGDEVNVGIDMNGGDLFLPDGSIFDITQNIYDEATKTYYIDTLDQSTNITQTFSWTYFIDYTSITYIGQTEEYNKYYEVYYELPDGRSSADLTAEELEQLNVSIDILPYIRSADDVSIRALYHFDGDTRDSSYWSYAGEFTWNSGASITYMDAGVFEGALYLNENAHQFTVTLPSNISSGDFTLQFRYYQSHTAAPQTDSSISVGGVTLMQFDGQSIKNGAGTVLTTVDVGNWQEICIMRSGSTVSYFHNGVRIGSVSNANGLNDKLVFTFGNGQQTYKYFDELRFVNKAVYSSVGYEVSSVPFDTNLALVLPDSKLPIADAYWNITSSKTNLLKNYGLADLTNFAYSTNSYISKISSPMLTTKVTGNSTSPDSYVWGPESKTTYNQSTIYTWPKFNMPDNLITISSDSAGTVIKPTNILPDMNPTWTWANYQGYNDQNTYMTFRGLNDWDGSDLLIQIPSAALFTMLGYNANAGANSSGKVVQSLAAGNYVFSVVSASGEVASVNFTMPTMSSLRYVLDGYDQKQNISFVSTTAFGYTFGYLITWGNLDGDGLQCEPACYLLISPTSSNPEPIMYMELASGTSTDLSAEYVEDVVVMDKDDLNTPSLAVKTDLEITGHQIGGMRPSLPTKGLVWALVEGGVIKSLQIYNGSAWEAVDGRIWTGERWVPYSAYNVLLMKDMYDVSGVVTPEDFEYIYTEQGFWSWWQKSWNSFVTWLQGKDGTLPDDSGGGDASDDVLPPVDDGEEGEKWTFLDLLVGLKDGLWNIGKGITVVVFDGVGGVVNTVTSIGDYFTVFDEGGAVHGIYDGGVNVWD